MEVNPCITCGACCAHFRASFYWREASDETPGGVPVEMTEDLTPVYRVMKGTNQSSPRCIALQGEIGTAVFCSIHPNRANVCRDFPPSFLDGIHNPRCDQARAAHNLPPLTLADWRPAPDDDITPAA